MTDVRELLVPLDGTGDSLPALRVAAALAALTGVPVSGLVVCSPGDDGARDRAWLAERAADVGLELRRRIVTPSMDVPPAVVEGASEPGTLLCMSSHGRSGIAELLLGSDGNEIVRTSPGPVLLVGRQVDPPKRFERIMVCLDGSALADRALDIAADLAVAFRMSLVLVQVVDPDGMQPSDLRDDDSLRRAVGELADRGIDADWKVLFDARTDRALVEHADATRADLIVVGTHGRTGLHTLAMGSVASGIVRRAHQPVLVVPAPLGERDAG